MKSIVHITLTALLGLGCALPSSFGQSIFLNAGTIDTSAAAPARRALAETTGDQLHLVQFDGPIQPEWVAQLQAAGYRIVDFVPDNTYIVYGGASARKAVRAGLSHVQWEGAYLAADKINPRARPAALLARQATSPGSNLFAVQLIRDDTANAATLALIEDLKLAPVRSRVSNPQLGFVNVVVALPADRIEELAARPDVLTINTYEFPQPLCERQAQIVAGNLNAAGSQPSGVGYYAWLTNKGFAQAQFDSSGFIVDIADDGWDNGVAATPANREFRKYGDAAQASRMKYSRNGSDLLASGSHGADGHGNLNISIVGGFSTNSGSPFVDSNGYHRGQGICPFANLGNTKVFEDGGSWGPTEEQEVAFIASNYSSGVRISSDSWGMPGDGAYDVNSQNYDTWTRDSQPAVSGNQQVLYVFAAGNAGSGANTIGAPGTGKNIISVGAAENYNQYSGDTDGSGVGDSGSDNANDIIDFSSRGPCDDQRKKPDIVAPGTHVQGAASFYAGYTGDGVSDKYRPAGQTNYASSSGTSHSTPAVAGGSALVYQYFINQGWSTNPSPAMVKAYLMNSTRYMTGVDTGDTLPSNNQGMGMMNLGNAFDGTARILRDQLTNDLFTASGQSRTFYGTVSDTNKPLRITLGWTDAPGSTSGNAYKNNLDLVVTVGGVAYKGNVFSGSNSTAGGSADVRNNVECVFRPAGTTGLVQVTVSGNNINSDGVPNYGGALDQDFVLVVYNATAFTPSNYPPVLDAIGDKTVSTNQLLQFTVFAADSVDSDTVNLWATGVPAWATFIGDTNAAAASCPFSGTAPAVTGSYAVTFYAADKDGTNSEAITITVNDCVPTNIIDEGFDGGTTAPEGWTFTGVSTYPTAGNYGRASPSLKFDSTGDQIVTPALNSPTNLQFWYKGQGAPMTSALLIEGYNGSTWNTVVDLTSLSTTATTQSVVLADGLAQLRFTFTKASGNLALDDVIIGGCGGGGGAINHAPIISVAGGTNQSVVVDNPLSFIVTVNDADAESVGVFTNAAPAGASFPEATGTAPIQSTFSWTPAATGQYTAAFVAYDAQTAVTQAVHISVTATPVELLAPVVQAASDVLADQFNANWLASSNATGYILDVATNASFSGGGGGGVVTNISENIQSWTAHTSYGTWTQSIPAGTVNMTQCIVSPAAAASGVGTIGRVQLQASAGILELPALDTVGTVTMNIAAGAIRTVKLQKYNGSTWDDLTTWSGIGTTGAAFTYDVNDSGSSVRLRIASPSGAIYVHDIIVTSYGEGGVSSFVPGYENRDAGNVTACAVTGLTEGVTYYYRVKAYNATSNSAYSATTNVTTSAGVNVPPVLGAIGNKSVTVGSNLQFQVSATPTDADTVTLTASNLPGSATFNATNENGTFAWLGAAPTGAYSVAFYATDKDGSDSETITITVGEASAELLPPVIQAASSIQATQFNATWLASANAIGYRLDVATNSAFRHGVYRKAATLSPGDLMIVTVNTDTNPAPGKGFDAVPLVDLDAGTVIYFTDNGWSNGTWRANEGIVTYTAPGAIAAGTVLSYRSATANGFTFNANFNLAGGGDNILVYQGSTNSPQFLYGIGWATPAPWVANCTGANNSEIPAALSTGAFTIVACGNLDNYQYNAANGTTGSKETLLQLVASSNNWNSSETTPYGKFTPDFTVGGGTPVNDYVPGYENRDVANVTTFAVTGLTEGVTYYYRAMAYNAVSNSGYSAVTSVVTAAASGTPPVLNAIGGQSVFLGHDLQFAMTATPTDADAVTLTASNLPSGATFGATNENGSFRWDNASPTGVYSVAFYATDKDGTDNETVGINVYPPPAVSGFSASNGVPASATVQSVNGQHYRLEYTTNLLALPLLWHAAASNSGNGSALILQDTNPVDIQRFYRVVIP